MSTLFDIKKLVKEELIKLKEQAVLGVKHKEKHNNTMSKTVSESAERGRVVLKEHIKILLENRKDHLNEVKEGVMAELDIIMDEASDFKDFLKRINRDSRLETSLLNSPDMIKFFTKIWKESGRSL